MLILLINKSKSRCGTTKKLVDLTTKYGLRCSKKDQNTKKEIIYIQKPNTARRTFSLFLVNDTIQDIEEVKKQQFSMVWNKFQRNFSPK